MFDKLIAETRKLIGDLGGQLRATKKTLQAKRQARDELAAAAISKADAIAAFNALVDARAAQHLKMLRERITRRAACGDPAKVADCPDRSAFLVLAPPDDHLATPRSNEGALCWLFGEQMKKRFAETVSGMDWLQNTMDFADKTAQLRIIDGEIASLEKDLVSLAEAARGAGINVNL